MVTVSLLPFCLLIEGARLFPEILDFSIPDTVSHAPFWQTTPLVKTGIFQRGVVCYTPERTQFT
ncbi:MAG: hypothetical protein ACP5M4_06235 [Acidobacteriaceae bacterium]